MNPIDYDAMEKAMLFGWQSHFTKEEYAKVIRQAKAGAACAGALQKSRFAFQGVLVVINSGNQAAEKWAVDNGLPIPGRLGEEIGAALAAWNEATK